jgi:CheY-like chemotaxis protein
MSKLTAPAKKVLVVDDEAIVRHTVVEILTLSANIE